MYSKKEIMAMVQQNQHITDVEIYRYSDRTRRIHTDTLDGLDVKLEELPDEWEGKEDYLDCEIMDKERYDDSIYANSSMNIDDWWENDDNRVMVVIVPEDFIL